MGTAAAGTVAVLILMFVPTSAGLVITEEGPGIIIDSSYKFCIDIPNQERRGGYGNEAAVLTDEISLRLRDGAENFEADQPVVAVLSYIWPTQGEVTSRFGRRSASVGSTNHKGADIGGSNGQPIYAAGAGEVIVSGWSDSYGYIVQIEHENGHITLYCHCSKLLADVGDTVYQGQEIARMGATGIASGAHLHFEIIIDGVNVDPLLYLPPDQEPVETADTGDAVKTVKVAKAGESACFRS